jgi:excisionase family DNA binding protein
MLGAMDIVSTKDVASMLGVSEATVKRWADAGTLRCFRTAGGHRKFRLRDVQGFLAAQDEASVVKLGESASTGNLSPEQADVRRLALDADSDGLVSFVANQRLRGVSLAETFDRIFAPALRDIGESWSAGRLNAAQEHIASGTISDTLARIRPLVERATPADRGRALSACIGEERHDIGLKMLALVLISEGFRVASVGASVPATDLALLVAGSAPSLVALSASACADPAALTRDLAIVTEAAAPVRAQVIVGGPGFLGLEPLAPSVSRFSSLEALVHGAFREGASRAHR